MVGRDRIGYPSVGCEPVKEMKEVKTMKRHVVVGFMVAIASIVALANCEKIGEEENPPVIATEELKVGYVGTYYTDSLEATGGNRPYEWSKTGGQLPPGLSLAREGIIYGTPSQEGTFNFTVQVKDEDGNTASKGLSITILPQGGGGGGSGGGLYDPGFNAQICSGEEWLSAVEVLNIPLDNNILSTLYTILRNDGKPGVVQGNNFIRYANDFGDSLYFCLGDSVTPSRLVVLSHCPVYNLGQIRRLDASLLEMAGYLSRAANGISAEEFFDIIGDRVGRRYYAQQANVYSRVYLESFPCEGYINVPENVTNMAMVGIASTAGGCATASWWSCSRISHFNIDGNQLVGNERSGNIRIFTYWTGTLSVGTHSFSFGYHSDCASWCGPCSYRAYIIDAAGENKTQPLTITVSGQLQPALHALDISELIRP